MVRLIALLALLAAPASADCFAKGQLRLVHFASGQTAGIREQTPQDLTYSMAAADGTVTTTEIRNGLFLLSQTTRGILTRFQWSEALPRVDELPLGQTRSFSARAGAAGGLFDFRVEISVLRHEVLRVASCDYPVTVVDRQDFVNGQPQSHATLWYSSALGLSLKSQTVDTHGRAQRNLVAWLE